MHFVAADYFLGPQLIIRVCTAVNLHISEICLAEVACHLMRYVSIASSGTEKLATLIFSYDSTIALVAGVRHEFTRATTLILDTEICL